MTDVTKTVLAVVAHPDDAEFLCAGTLALLQEKGWQVELASMTPGDCGSATLPREEISHIRRQEAGRAAALLAGNYHCLECDDAFIMYDRPTVLRTVELVRQTRPKLVFTMSPSDYMVDHEMTSRLVQTACFTAGIANIATGDIPPFHRVPHLYYLDPLEGKDKFGREIAPSIFVDISRAMDIKEKMLACHASQRSWLQAHHGVDQYIDAMKAFSARRGQDIRRKYAEGFRQHLGHAYPQQDVLQEELGNLVHYRK
jgi:LmbE family N-acetylglucosaminyl deacetylase